MTYKLFDKTTEHERKDNIFENSYCDVGCEMRRIRLNSVIAGFLLVFFFLLVSVSAAGSSFETFVAILAGNKYSLALKSDGSLAGWGADQRSERFEVTVPAGKDFIAIVCGDEYRILALKSDGTLVLGTSGDDDGELPDVKAAVPAGLGR